MRCTPEHSTLGFYAAPTRTDTKAFPTLPHTDSVDRGRLAVVRFICGHRNHLYATQCATPTHLSGTEGRACRLSENPECRKLSFPEDLFSETGLPILVTQYGVFTPDVLLFTPDVLLYRVDRGTKTMDKRKGIWWSVAGKPRSSKEASHQVTPGVSTMFLS
jgi:hypothetical protein